MISTSNDSACQECPGRCCKQRSLGFPRVYLTPWEAEDPLFEPHVTWARIPGKKEQEAFMSLNPTCPFLAKDTNMCSVYEQRPDACRGFTCWSDPEMERPKVLDRLLKKHGHL